MTRWAWIAETTAGQALGELTQARERKLDFDVRGPATASFSIDGRDPQAQGLAALRNDLFCYRERELLFRGRLGGAVDDDLDENSHRVAFAAVDYRALLGARTTFMGELTFDGQEQTDIAWSLISLAQAGEGGNLGITRGLRPARRVNRTESFDADAAIDECISRFEDYDTGFEWEIDPGLALNCYSWRGAVRNDFPLAYGSTVTRLRRSLDSGLYANWVRVRGGKPDGAKVDQPEPVSTRYASTLSTMPEGRIMRVVQNYDLKTQAACDAAADALLKDSLSVPAAFAVTLAPGRWTGPRDLWLGDRPMLIVRSGRLNVAVRCRVNQLAIAVGDDGEETVEMTVGHS